MNGVEDLTPFEALDQVKRLRAAWRACGGALYKNAAVGQMQTFLEACIAKWGESFMECVARERDEELCSLDYMERYYGDKGRRKLVFPEVLERGQIEEDA